MTSRSAFCRALLRPRGAVEQRATRIGPPLRGHEHVLQLHVPVHHVSGVEESEAVGQLPAHIGRLAVQEAAVGPAAEHREEVAAAHELQHHQEPAGFLEGVHQPELFEAF